MGMNLLGLELVKFWNKNCNFKIQKDICEQLDPTSLKFKIFEELTDEDNFDIAFHGELYLTRRSGTELKLRERLGIIHRLTEGKPTDEIIIIILREERINSNNFDPHSANPDTIFNNITWVELFDLEVSSEYNVKLSLGIMTTPVENYVCEVSFCGVDGEIIPNFGSDKHRYADYLPIIPEWQLKIQVINKLVAS